MNEFRPLNKLFGIFATLIQSDKRSHVVQRPFLMIVTRANAASVSSLVCERWANLPTSIPKMSITTREDIICELETRLIVLMQLNDSSDGDSVNLCSLFQHYSESSVRLCDNWIYLWDRFDSFHFLLLSPAISCILNDLFLNDFLHFSWCQSKSEMSIFLQIKLVL